ncbi:PHP domain-containing protein [Caloramator sp. E03]|uniref:PHP domain-containing protein n=1 Tax=Caloramator sp. E03 TaxID=2576307 RepID=UPI00111035B3|nr:PHP domain-containing protein [Caloramator sp. E03]QCX34470.1 PHP domain-containing protein [Caloramator sp. E03]
MKIFADYHTHTKYSHGKGTIRQNVEAAIKKGLKEIVISDHGPAHVFYGVRKKQLKEMREKIDKLQSEYPQIKIMLGVEANIISCDGDIDVDEEDIKLLDKLLVGFHNGAMPKDFKSFYNLSVKNKLSKIIPSFKGECRRLNTEALVKAINKYDIFLITHPGAKVDIDTRILARAAAKRGTILEINSSHGYMTSEYVKIAMEEGAYFAIDSDAHNPKDVGNFEKGIEIAKKAGLSEDRIVNALK